MTAGAAPAGTSPAERERSGIDTDLESALVAGLSDVRSGVLDAPDGLEPEAGPEGLPPFEIAAAPAPGPASTEAADLGPRGEPDLPPVASAPGGAQGARPVPRSEGASPARVMFRSEDPDRADPVVPGSDATDRSADPAADPDGSPEASSLDEFPLDSVWSYGGPRAELEVEPAAPSEHGEGSPSERTAVSGAEGAHAIDDPYSTARGPNEEPADPPTAALGGRQQPDELKAGDPPGFPTTSELEQALVEGLSAVDDSYREAAGPAAGAPDGGFDADLAARIERDGLEEATDYPFASVGDEEAPGVEPAPGLAPALDTTAVAPGALETPGSRAAREDAMPSPSPDPASAVPFVVAGEAPGALAFATDPESEDALREALAEHPEPQVWPGGLRSAVAALAAGHSPRLLFVDLDGTAYPAGAIHELAAVCEVGTAVVAFGSNATARFSREVLLAGVGDYLVKPLGAAAVRAAAARATAPGDGLEAGRIAAFTGTGGSGATTLAALTALLAAERGRYVSVLDLGRAFSALPFALDVHPAPGLDQLLETAERAAPEAEMVEAVRAWRSDRIAVCGHRFGPSPPPAPSAAAVRRVLADLARGSHLVVVDGLEDPATRVAALAAADTAVLVAEPTAGGAARAARLIERLDPQSREGGPLALVVNHTRALPRAARRRALRAAGVPATPEAVVPFEPSVPPLADRGWPRGKCPASVAKPLGALVDRLLEAPPAPAPERVDPPPRRGWRRWPATLSGLRPA